MSSPHYTKLGVHISADCTRLQRYYSVPSHSYFELSHLYKSVFLASTPELINRKSVAMSAIVRDVYGLEIAKEQNIRGSDWSRKVDVNQIDYALSDAVRVCNEWEWAWSGKLLCANKATVCGVDAVS